MAPNFLVMIVDQMNSFSLGWNGNPGRKDHPIWDKLCSEGVNFGRAYTSNPVCSPLEPRYIRDSPPANTD